MKRILIVEDSEPNRELLIEILKGEAACDCAENVTEAATKFNMALREKKYYHLILLDIGLPEISGMQFLKSIRHHEQEAGIPTGEGIPIIMVTATKSRFLEAYDKGCHDYVLKPIDPDVLREKVKKYLHSRIF